MLKAEKHMAVLKNENSISIYRSSDSVTTVYVKISAESVWLSLNQMSDLFDRDKSVISRHIRNVFKENELERNSVVAYFATTAADGKTYNVEYYNLDVIISVGYRVKSQQGTQFRIWANRVLKEYLLQGYALNEKKLQKERNKIIELNKAVTLLANIIDRKELSADEANGLLRVITDYTYGLDLLDRYDFQTLRIENTSGKGSFQINYKIAKNAIKKLGKHTGAKGFFGKEKDESFKSSLDSIYQTFDGNELYPSIEEKAANLLYFIVKNHSFIDGNKRIGAFLF
jgi:hypothetical protein